MSNKENTFIYMQGVSQGREELEDKVKEVEDGYLKTFEDDLKERIKELEGTITNGQVVIDYYKAQYIATFASIEELENKIKFLQHHCRESGKAIEGLCSRAAELTEEKCNFCKCEKPINLHEGK